jgi:predicted  nucleic acid-binding Zn-ribbon protein
MRPRRSPPSLVSMWMLDVFCCALGCVTLLWLLNTREAKSEAIRASAALTDLASTRENLAAAKADAEATRRTLNAQIDDLRGKLVATADERDELAKQLAVARAESAALDQTLKATVARTVEQDDQLARKQKLARELAAKLAASQVTSDELAKLLRTTEKDRDAVLAKASELDERLNDADAKYRAALTESKEAKDALAAMRKTGDQLANATNANKTLQDRLDAMNATIIDLQGDKKKLADKYDKLRVDSDAKFAGIATTGKRVAFLVDISGSMKLVDEKTPEATKWPTVVETVGKVMRSIPDLEAFQVVTFSRTADVLFPGGFQPYRGEQSIADVTRRLKAVEPVGDTNLYAGLDLAFRLRSTGLDTVYLFSDGLPTSGPGLTAEQEAAKIPDVMRSELLSKHLRDTLKRDWNLANAKGQRVRINAVGFFYESPDVGAFLWSLARENDGSFVGMSRP